MRCIVLHHGNTQRLHRAHLSFQASGSQQWAMLRIVQQHPPHDAVGWKDPSPLSRLVPFESFDNCTAPLSPLRQVVFRWPNPDNRQLSDDHVGGARPRGLLRQLRRHGQMWAPPHVARRLLPLAGAAVRGLLQVWVIRRPHVRLEQSDNLNLFGAHHGTREVEGVPDNGHVWHGRLHQRAKLALRHLHRTVVHARRGKHAVANQGLVLCHLSRIPEHDHTVHTKGQEEPADAQPTW
mmetsp:Transcript_101790/g.326917  ORF Transcript_101790/g.326917 Transcript_101790/m.326917 type:complete len:236 (+) Transcript_101790:573-1280(+)